MTGAARDQRLVFGEVADLYHRFRPGYPPSVFDAISDFGHLQAGAPVLEVGAGTGKATAALLERGWRVLALEPDFEMSAVAIRELGPRPGFDLAQEGFEEWDPRGRHFELLCSAQAWHWVDPELGFPKAARVLAPGGTLALLWNRPEGGDPDLRRRLDAVYLKLAPQLSARPPGELDVDRRREIEASRLFGPAELVRVAWERTFSAAEYVHLMLTQSDHRLLARDDRRRLLDDVFEVITRAGGHYRVGYVTLLYLAHSLR